MLGSAAMTAPSAALAGPAPEVRRGSATLAASTLADLRERIRTKKGARFEVRPLQLLGAGVAEAVHRREVSIAKIDKRLRDVVAYADEPVLVGSSGPRAALLGALPEPNRTEDEVNAYVESLVKNDRIAFQPKKSTSAVSLTREKIPQPNTHIIRSVGRKKVLTRVRFLCRCC
jgi:hypothetical protein